MDYIIFLMWMLIWIIFLGMSIIEKKGHVFGFLAGLHILFLGSYIYIDGFELQTGCIETVVGDVTTIEYTFTEVVTPFSSYGVMWALPFILLGIYIMYRAVMKYHGTLEF